MVSFLEHDKKIIKACFLGLYLEGSFLGLFLIKFLKLEDLIFHLFYFLLFMYVFIYFCSRKEGFVFDTPGWPGSQIKEIIKIYLLLLIVE